MTDTTSGYTHYKGIDAEHLCIGGVEVDQSSWGITNLVPTVAQLNTLYASYVAQLTNPVVIRKNVTTAQMNAGTTAVVPAVAGMRFQVLGYGISMRANGTAAGPTTIGLKEDGGAVFLSHVTADMTDGVWNSTVGGTAVITGLTTGGMTAVANKALLAYVAGGTALITTTSVDYIVAGYYTTA
jgi:hypothetical protein